MKKKKDQWEEEAKNHFVAELKAQGRGESIVVDSDVVVDAQTNRNFDYQVKCGDDFIALEIFRLVESQQEIVRSKSWSTIADSIAAELRRKGIKGYTIQTPNAFNVSRRKIPEFVSKISSAGLDADWRTTPLSRPRVYRTAIPSMVVTGASNCLTTLSARRRSTAHTAGRVSFIPAAYKRDEAIFRTSRVKCTL